MRIVCAPLKQGFDLGGSSDLEIVLFGHADIQDRGGAGANIAREVVQKC